MLKLLGFLLRVYSYLFHLVLSLFLIGIGIISVTSRQPLNLAMLPFPESSMVTGVVAFGLIGLLSTALAITRVFKYLFPIWAGYILYVAVRGLLFSPYTFPDAASFKEALWLMLCLLGAFVGALWTLKPRRGRLYS